MSWDVFIMAFPPEIQEIKQVPDDWDPPSLGTGAHVRGVLAQVLPGITYSGEGWGDYEGADFSLSTPLNEAEDAPVTGLTLFIHGGGPGAATAALAVADALKARAADLSTGGFLTTDSAQAALDNWRDYRDRALHQPQAAPAAKQRFLVLHDYGMGGLWWWIHARSAREVLETFAEVEVIDTAEAVDQAQGWGLKEVDVDATELPADLDNLHAKRQTQRERPGFGALADRTVVYLRRRWDGEDDVEAADYLMEIGSDGRRMRQVEIEDSGEALKIDSEDWIFNPPAVDLFDPDLTGQEISRQEFEAAWARARKDDGLL